MNKKWRTRNWTKYYPKHKQKWNIHITFEKKKFCFKEFGINEKSSTNKRYTQCAQSRLICKIGMECVETYFYIVQRFWMLIIWVLERELLLFCKYICTCDQPKEHWEYFSYACKVDEKPTKKTCIMNCYYSLHINKVLIYDFIH